MNTSALLEEWKTHTNLFLLKNLQCWCCISGWWDDSHVAVFFINSRGNLTVSKLGWEWEPSSVYQVLPCLAILTRELNEGKADDTGTLSDEMLSFSSCLATDNECKWQSWHSHVLLLLCCCYFVVTVCFCELPACLYVNVTCSVLYTSSPSTLSYFFSLNVNHHHHSRLHAYGK